MDKEVAVVVYHHISSKPDRLTSQLGVTTSPELFEQHIRYFAKNFDFISLDNLLNHELPRKSLLVTFDDAYKSVLEAGAPILSAHRAPSLFFLNASTIKSASLPIDNLLSYSVEELGLERVRSILKLDAQDIGSTKQLISTILSTMSPAGLAEVRQRITAELGTGEHVIREQSGLFLSENDLAQFGNHRIEVGNHSMSHTYFRALSGSELESEIVGGRLELQRLSKQNIRSLAVPYGNEKDATTAALNIARASHHQAIFLVHARSNRFRPAKDIYYRTSVESTSASALPVALRMMPVLRSLRNWIR